MKKTVLLKDAIILVFYISVKYIDAADVPAFLDEFANTFSKDNDGSVQMYFIPSNEINTSRVECINPKLITEKQYKQVQETIDKFQRELDRLTKEIKTPSE